MDELSKKQQKIRFSGSGVSHQNRSAYCAINTLVTMAETTLIHTDLRYTKDIFSAYICPMVMEFSVWIYSMIHDI